MKELTYTGWRDAGYQVMKGEKSTGRNSKGEPTFRREQVTDAVDNEVRDEPSEDLDGLDLDFDDV